MSQLIYEDEHGKQFIASHIADRGEFWWDPKRPGESMLFDSKIYLGEAFFNEITRVPVPLDMNILKALKRSSLGLDWYLWLTYRTFALRAPLRLSWWQLYRQFGAHPAQAGRQEYREQLPHEGPTRVEEDQDRLAGAELRYSQGRADPLALEARHSYSAAAFAREIAANTSFAAPGSFLTALQAQPIGVGPPEPLKTTSAMSCGDAAVRFIHRCL